MSKFPEASISHSGFKLTHTRASENITAKMAVKINLNGLTC